MSKKGIDFPPPPPRGENDEFLSSLDSPEKNRRTFTKSEQGSGEPAVQVETKPGLAWTEPEPSAPAVRERRKPKAPVDAEPLVQVETKKPATAEPVESDSRIEPTLGAELGQPGEPIKATEMTTGESRTLLSKLIDGYKKTLEGAKENVEWWKSSEEHLIRRSKDLDAQLEKIEGIEKGFRWLGENYNKLGWKTKLAVGLALGIGAGVASVVSMPTAIACLSGIAVQRIAGLATMYLKFEKNRQDGKWEKEKALGKAILYTAAMTGAMMLLTEGVKEGVEYADKHHWLGNMLGHHTEAPNVAPAHSITEAPSAPEVVHPAAVSSAGEVAAQAATPEVPTVMVHASSGHGYEYMVKQMWKDLQEMQLDSSTYAEGSDIRRLLEADASSIDKVVHDIATDPSHEFFNPDGTSAVIRSTDILTVGANGQVLLMTPDDVITHAPVGGPTTPAYHPSAVEQQAPLSDRIVPPDTSPAALEDQEINPDNIVVPGPEIIPPHAEVPAPAASEPLQEVNVVSPEPIKTVNLTHEQELRQQEIDAVNASIHETPASDVTDMVAHEVAPTNVTSPEVSPNAGEIVSRVYENGYGTLIDPDVTHGYLSAKGLYVFGGTELDASAEEYALKNRVSVFVDKSYKNWLGWTTSRVIEYVPTDGGPPTMVIHNGPSLIPDPKDFTKRVF